MLTSSPSAAEPVEMELDEEFAVEVENYFSGFEVSGAFAISLSKDSAGWSAWELATASKSNFCA